MSSKKRARQVINTFFSMYEIEKKNNLRIPFILRIISYNYWRGDENKKETKIMKHYFLNYCN